MKLLPQQDLQKKKDYILSLGINPKLPEELLEYEDKPQYLKFLKVFKTLQLGLIETRKSCQIKLPFESEFTDTDEIFQKAGCELDQYLTFSRGWDGYDGVLFEASLVSEMKSLLNRIKGFFEEDKIVPDEITPGPASDGSVDLEIVYRNKCLILTRYPNDKYITVYFEDKQGSPEEKEIEFSRFNLEAELIRLVS